jgi:hypothetical protein
MYDVELLNMDENSATISSISSESTVFPQLFTYNPLMYSRISFFIASKHFVILILSKKLNGEKLIFEKTLG